MQQATSAHSGARTGTSPVNITNISTPSRRGLLGLAGVSALACATPGVAIDFPAPASAVMAAIRANDHAESRFNSLPDTLERTDPARHKAEEALMHDAYDNCLRQTPTNWSEFVAMLSVATDEGNFELDESRSGNFMRHARRLLATTA